MPKKKSAIVGSAIGYPSVPTRETVEPPKSDNNPDGPYAKPSYASDPSRGYPSENIGGTKRFSFTELVGQGESPNKGDVIVNTANGISSSKGKNKGCQYNYGNGNSGVWNDNEFDNGNLTGM